MESAPPKKNYWPNVHSPLQREKGAVRSCHLFVQGTDLTKVWTKVDEFTKSGHLGYMSSIAPEAMSEGPYQGFTCISVHCEEAKKDGVYKNLQECSMDHFICKDSNYRSEPQEDMLPDSAKNEEFHGAVKDGEKPMREDEAVEGENEVREDRVKAIDHEDENKIYQK